MRILIVSQYFWPEPFIINDLVLALEHHGHEVTVLTGKPNYPDGKLYSGYQQKGLQRESYGKNIAVYRVPLRPRGTATSTSLALNYLSFIWAGLRYFSKLVKNSQFDVILVFAPSPITSAIPAIALKRMKKTHLAIWVQDLWPESLSATGHIRHPWLLKIMEELVRLIYRFTDTLLIQSQAFRVPVAALASSDKIIYYPNSVQLTQSEINAPCLLPTDLIDLLESKFCIVFAGNIGKAQAMATIVEVAKRLANTEIVLVLVGSGSELAWVREQKEAHSLHNLVLAGRFPMAAMPDIYGRAAGLLVTLRRDEIFGYTIPSKIQAYLAAGKPIVAALDGEGARVVSEAKAGFTSSAEDEEALAANILRLHESSPEMRRKMGERGHRYFMENFEMSKQAENLVNILQTRIKKQRQA